MTTPPTIHATAVLVGSKALLVRGEPGSGKSRLALRLIQCGSLPFVRLVGDDRVHVEAKAGRLLVRPAAQLAGLIEVRGLGIRQLPYETSAVVGTIVDLVALANRLPEPASRDAAICDVIVPRLLLPADADPLPPVLAALAGRPAAIDRNCGLG